MHVLLQVDGPEEEQPLESPGDLRVQWLHRGGDDEPLADAVRALDFPAGEVHAFVHGEASAVRALRRHLLAERGIPRESVSISGYWKRRRTEEGWREDKPEWNRLVEADLTRPSREAQDQLRGLERDVELRAVADVVEHDPVGVRQPVLAVARPPRTATAAACPRSPTRPAPGSRSSRRRAS